MAKVEDATNTVRQLGPKLRVPEPAVGWPLEQPAGRGRGDRIYRHVNERIRELEVTYDFGEPLQMFCECAATGCTTAIAVDREQYDDVRGLCTQFFVAPGHARQRVEKIVERRPDYWVVEER